MIHPTAVIHETAVIGDDNEIGPFCVIGPNVVIGNGNRFTSHVCIGTPGQHRSRHREMGVEIGNGNTFREFSQVHHGVEKATRVGDDCYIMSGASVQHDCVIEDGVTLCSNVSLGGHVWVMRGANLGHNACVHQFQRIGSYAMLGMGAVVPKFIGIEPGQVYVGNPARWLRTNDIGLERAGITELSDEFRRWSHAA